MAGDLRSEGSGGAEEAVRPLNPKFAPGVSPDCCETTENNIGLPRAACCQVVDRDVLGAVVDHSTYSPAAPYPRRVGRGRPALPTRSRRFHQQGAKFCNSLSRRSLFESGSPSLSLQNLDPIPKAQAGKNVLEGGLRGIDTTSTPAFPDSRIVAVPVQGIAVPAENSPVGLKSKRLSHRWREGFEADEGCAVFTRLAIAVEIDGVHIGKQVIGEPGARF